MKPRTELRAPEYPSGLSLDELLSLAARYHLGEIRFSGVEAVKLIRALKNKACAELDEGDGKRCQTVRVEKQLGGKVSLFFGF